MAPSLVAGTCNSEEAFVNKPAFEHSLSKTIQTLVAFDPPTVIQIPNGVCQVSLSGKTAEIRLSRVQDDQRESRKISISSRRGEDPLSEKMTDC